MVPWCIHSLIPTPHGAANTLILLDPNHHAPPPYLHADWSMVTRVGPMAVLVTAWTVDCRHRLPSTAPSTCCHAALPAASPLLPPLSCAAAAAATVRSASRKEGKSTCWGFCSHACRSEACQTVDAKACDEGHCRACSGCLRQCSIHSAGLTWPGTTSGPRKPEGRGKHNHALTQQMLMSVPLWVPGGRTQPWWSAGGPSASWVNGLTRSSSINNAGTSGNSAAARPSSSKTKTRNELHQPLPPNYSPSAALHVASTWPGQQS